MKNCCALAARMGSSLCPICRGRTGHRYYWSVDVKDLAYYRHGIVIAADAGEAATAAAAECKSRDAVAAYGVMRSDVYLHHDHKECGCWTDSVPAVEITLPSHR